VQRGSGRVTNRPGYMVWSSRHVADRCSGGVRRNEDAIRSCRSSCLLTCSWCCSRHGRHHLDARRRGGGCRGSTSEAAGARIVWNEHKRVRISDELELTTRASGCTRFRGSYRRACERTKAAICVCVCVCVVGQVLGLCSRSARCTSSSNLSHDSSAATQAQDDFLQYQQLYSLQSPEKSPGSYVIDSVSQTRMNDSRSERRFVPFVWFGLLQSPTKDAPYPSHLSRLQCARPSFLRFSGRAR